MVPVRPLMFRFSAAAVSPSSAGMVPVRLLLLVPDLQCGRPPSAGMVVRPLFSRYKLQRGEPVERGDGAGQAVVVKAQLPQRGEPIKRG